MSRSITLRSSDFAQGTIHSNITNVTNNSLAVHSASIPIEDFELITVNAYFTSNITSSLYVRIVAHKVDGETDVFYSTSAGINNVMLALASDYVDFQLLITMGSANGYNAVTPSNIGSVTIKLSTPFYIDDDGELRIEQYTLRPTTPNTNKAWWRIVPGVNDGLPFNLYMPLSPYLPAVDGAFTGVLSLKRVHIPESVRRIGERSFEGTSLASVKISADCEYSEDSFPEDCEVNIR